MSGGGAEVVTFGCRLNAFEGEAMRGLAERAGLADTVIVNTCAVTSRAERQARQTIRRLRRERPTARILVTGCAAQIAPERYAAMPEVDRVIGNAEKLRPESYAPETIAAAPRIAAGDIFAAGEAAALPFVEGFEGRARAVVQVQQGCDHRCTFCIIPYGRGNSRSLPMGAIVEQTRRLAASGYAEIVLTGIDLASFGRDLPGRPSLGQMIRRLLALVPELKRLRLSSLDPAAIDDDLWRLVAEEARLMPHLHLSLQSGDDLVLKRMKRRHGRAEAVTLCRRARALRPGIAFGADLIAGFPTEDEAMFRNTLALVEECGLDYLHVFPYSPRAGTPASRMPQVPGPAIKERAERLRRRGAEALRRSLERRVGGTAELVVERGAVGHTEHYAPVRLAGDGFVAGTLRRVRLVGLTEGGDALIGEAA